MDQCPKCGGELEPEKGYCGACGYNARFDTSGAAEAIEKVEVEPAKQTGSARVGGRGTTPNGDLTAQAREALSGNWGLAVGTFFLYALILNVIGWIPFLGTIAAILVAGPFVLGITIFTLNISRRNNPELAQMFDGFKQFGNALGAYWLIFIFVFLWSLLLIVPGIIKGIAYSMTYMIIADDPEISCMDAIRKSQEIMDGNKWKLFLFGFRFLGWGLLCILTLGIGYLWLMPYAAVSFARFYEDVK